MNKGKLITVMLYALFSYTVLATTFFALGCVAVPVLILLLPPMVLGCVYTFKLARVRVENDVASQAFKMAEQENNEKSALLTAREADFENHVREINADLQSREESMLERTKQNTIALLREEYDKSVIEIQEKKTDANFYFSQKVSEADAYFAKKTAEAAGYEHSVFLKCGSLKESMETVRLEVEQLNETRKRLVKEDQRLKDEIGEYIEEQLYLIDGMEDGHEFEHYFANLLKKSGYIGVTVTPGSGDFGVDVIAQRWGIPFAFQCKRYSQQVGNKAVQEIFSGMHTCDCNIGVVVTNNTFTSGAISQTRKNRILLWDRKDLCDIIAESYDKEQRPPN